MEAERDILRAISNKANVNRDDWFKIANAATDEAEIFIYDEIGWFGSTADEFANTLNGVTAGKIKVRLSSIGGSVIDGVAIHNALRTHPAYITTQVDSMAASIASVIAQAGDSRIMLKNSKMMIHEATGLALGATAGTMRELADILDSMTNDIATIYADRSGKDPAEFMALMQAGTSNLGTWFTAAEAVDAGLADEVFTPPAKTDSIEESQNLEGRSLEDTAPENTLAKMTAVLELANEGVWE